MSGTHPNFFLLKHTSEHLHYDLRLEIRGITRSWVLPITIPTEHDETRLAIEDWEEKSAYLDPEGIIEDGYGKGKYEIWDTGACEIIRQSKSRIELMTKGNKFGGRFVLLLPNWGRFYKKRLWLLIKVG